MSVWFWANFFTIPYHSVLSKFSLIKPVRVNDIVLCFSTAETCPGTGTWSPLHWELGHFETYKCI